MKNYGIGATLLGLLIIAVGIAYESAFYIITSRLFPGMTFPWYFTYPAYVLFFTGMIIFAVGVALTLFYVFIEAVKHYEEYKAFKTTLKKTLKKEE